MRADCWLFLGSKNADGYGGYGGTPAHRLSWEAHRGFIPKGKWVLHLCDNPPCINPDHLYIGTASDNNFDMYRRKRRGFVAPARKLTEAQVSEIRSSNLRPYLLARKYLVSTSNISKILKRQIWKSQALTKSTMRESETGEK